MLARSKAIAAGALVATVAGVGIARAFCGFFVSGADASLYNNASQVVLMRFGNHTAMTMSNNYKGPPENFAMVVPVPVVLRKGQVKTLRPEVFKAVDTLSAPRLVEYWEQDPCYVPPAPPPMSAPALAGGALQKRASKGDRPEDFGVKIEAKFQEGEYQILILSAKDSSGLEAWLRLSKYRIPAGAAEALAPYVREQMKFFVAKIDISKVKRDQHGLVVLSPLRFSFDSPELRLPVRLGLLNAEAKQDLLIYILAPGSRYEVANYTNAFIPSNVEVSDVVRSNFGAFYAELFDETVRRHNNRAVVTEYAWESPILHRAPVVNWQSYHCDPCPAPAQPPPTLSDWVSLGDETILGALANAQPKQAVTAPLPPGVPETWILTRLHTRYDKATLSDDLVFRVARPMTGGTANADGTNADEGATPSKDGRNRFQGRYIIRHYWEGPVACDNPRYGIWTGPPANQAGYRTTPGVAPGSGAPQTAGDLANAKRGVISLAKVVRSSVPSLNLRGVSRPPLRKGEMPAFPR
ncbi:MAG TPA: DUF2330 domain-containing protein [Polyangia bacterium]|nr:DUF2330 domain-containing protein [Polyangia bacterium]